MMTENKEAAPTIAYGRWPSSLSAEAIFSNTAAISYLRPGSNGIFFLLSMPAEQNDLALMYQSAEGRLTRVSPPGISVRSRVHEYGGLPYAVTDQTVYYSAFSNNVVYAQGFDQELGVAGAPQLLTPATKDLRYVDFIVDDVRRRLLCVREDHRKQSVPPVNTLVAIDLGQGGEGEILFADSDFVSSPCLSATGDLLAFQTWSHPNMPWDNTEIRISAFDEQGALSNLRQVAPNQPGSLVQPCFNAAGDLYFIADWSNWWNLYRVEAEDLRKDCKAQAVFPMSAECCAPQWQSGQHNYAFVDEDTLLLSINSNCVWELALLECTQQRGTTVASGFGLLEHVFVQHGKAIFIGGSSFDAPAIWQSTLLSHAPISTTSLFSCTNAAQLPAAEVALPEHFSFAIADSGDIAYGIFYQPCSTACRAPANSLPPLLVFVHGGPTSSARLAYNPLIQFWTSRGFAVLDVNHCGSSGYGRRFRRSLYGEWGVVDIADVISAVAHLVAEGRVAADKIAIRGSSAGGYAVLSALVQSDGFSAGTSYYGIGDLALLAADTHKFEAHYLDQLIGPWPEARALYEQRSPLQHISHIRAPVLLLQGGEDKVVPPNQAEQMFARLKEHNSATRYVYFADEGHGFRKPHNQILALNAELEFYEEVML